LELKLMSKSKQIRDFLAGLPDDEQREAISYLLARLLGHTLDANENITILKQDGTLLGHIRPLSPPSVEEAQMMNERGKRVDPKAGHSTQRLQQTMRAGDEDAVRAFIKNSSKHGS
jgi:hypothetical protein